MNRFIRTTGWSFLLAAGIVFSGQDTARQTVVLSVSAFGSLSVSGNPRLLLGLDGGAGAWGETEDHSSILSYTSTVGPGQHRSISAQMGETESAPAGCALSLRAAPSQSRTAGRSAGDVVLGVAPQTIVMDIGSCATNLDGPQGGAVLYYRLAVVLPTALIAGESRSVTVTFTLTDAA